MDSAQNGHVFVHILWTKLLLFDRLIIVYLLLFHGIFHRVYLLIIFYVKLFDVYSIYRALVVRSFIYWLFMIYNSFGIAPKLFFVRTFVR